MFFQYLQCYLTSTHSPGERYILWMCWDTSSVMYPGFIGCVGSHNIIHTHPGDPASVDQTLACIPAGLAHGSPLFIHSHLEALSAASVATLMAVLFAGPLMPSTVYLQSLCNLLLLNESWLANPVSGILPRGPDIWHTFFRKPPQSGPPKALSTELQDVIPPVQSCAA